MAEEEKKIRISTLIYSVLIILSVILGAASVLAYGTNTEIGGKISTAIAKIAPFPAAIVDWKNVVYLEDLRSNLASVEKFYKTNDFSQEGLRVDFSTESGKKRLKIKEKEILDKLIEDEAIEVLAKDRKVSVSQKEIERAVENKLDEFGTRDEVSKDLKKTYGWNLDDFKRRVVIPNAYKDALIKYVSENELDNSKAKEKASKAQQQLENGDDFEKVVGNFSEGDSREKGGELGWVRKDQVVAELQNALFGQDPYEKNSIIESSIGFHIIKIEEKKKDENQDVLRLRQIFVAKKTFADWLQEQKKSMRIMVPMKEFRWNEKDGMVEFRNEAMRKFETEERAKAQGDASIMF